MLERPSQLKSVAHAYTISQNLCVFLGLPNIDHGLLYSYEYHEHLTSCNVRCGKSFVRRPWLRSSMPLFSFDNVSSTVTNYSQHAHVLQRQVTCEPVVPPFNVIKSTMHIKHNNIQAQFTPQNMKSCDVAWSDIYIYIAFHMSSIQLHG